MRIRTSWARVAALAAALAVITSSLSVASAFAQEAPSQTLEQARSGEDGTSGAGATSGNTSTGNAKRDKDGNGGNASAGSAGEGGTTEPASSEEALPENAELLDALGILDDVTAYDLTVLSGLDIPIEYLPPPPADSVPAAPSDVDTGGVGSSGTTSGEATVDETTTDETSTISTEPGSGSAPAGGSTGTAAADGVGATNSSENRDRPRKNDNSGTVEAPGG